MASGYRCWGTFDHDAREVTIEDDATADNYDLVDVAAVRTLQASGEVVMIDDDEALGADIAAIYRYPLS